MQRTPISKSTRFSIFARDKFTCRYCGRQSDTVTLVIDHLIPVCQNGTNEETNLVTSCEECNQGKGGRTLEQNAPTEEDRLRILQEHKEQITVAKTATLAAESRRQLTEAIQSYYSQLFDYSEIPRQAMAIYARLAGDYGCDSLFDWLQIASAKLGPFASRNKVVQYVCGIRRRLEEEGEL